MNRLILVRALAVAIIGLSLVAPRSTQAQAPSPRAQLSGAHTAHLVNAGAGAGTFDDLTKALQQWGRFVLVEDVAQSDITITLGSLRVGRGWPLTITKTEGHAILWTDLQKKDLSDKALRGGSVGSSLITNLRNHLSDSPIVVRYDGLGTAEAPATVPHAPNVGILLTAEPGLHVATPVTSEPDGAEVFVDGAYVGSTPSTLLILVGEHALRIIRPGYKDWERRVTIEAESAKTFNAILIKADR